MKTLLMDNKLYRKLTNIIAWIIIFLFGLFISAFLLLLLLDIFVPWASANFAPKAQVEQCILLSLDKLVVPDLAAMTVSPTCVAEPCYQIPEGFSCIYYKITGDTLELDATKKLNYENALKDAQIVQNDFQDAQTVDAIRNYCLYMFNSGCQTLSLTNKNKVRSAVSTRYGTVKPIILLKLGL